MSAEPPPRRLRVAVIGAGAVGCYYGGRLAEAGHNVHFLLRRDYDAVRSRGLTIASPDGDFQLEQPAVARTSDAIGPVDWVLCALKATSLSEAEGLIRPCIGPQTRVLVTMNGLGLEERFARWFGDERIFGGMAFTCINRGAPGHVHHLRYGALTIGHLLDDEERLADATSLWRGSRVQVSSTRPLLKARWEKLCWNIPFNGMTVAAGGVPTDRIMGDAELRESTRELMREVTDVGNADLKSRGYGERLAAEEIIRRLLDLTETMGDYRPSTLIDYLEGRTLEVDAIFGEPLRRARALGVPTPRLALLSAVLRSLDARAGSIRPQRMREA